MHLQQSIRYCFRQLADAIKQLTNGQYTQATRSLSQASVGQHLRHIIELFECLEQGYEAGFVDYEARKRNRLIEDNKGHALELLDAICTRLNRPDKPLQLRVNNDADSGQQQSVASTYYREVLYNLEHTVHHMALIRIGLHEVANLQLPNDFGVAAATIKYKNACAP